MSRRRKYRGRRYMRRKAIAKTVIVTVLLVILALMVAFLFLQDKIVFSDGILHFNLPWDTSRPGEKTPDETDEDEIPVVIDDDPLDDEADEDVSLQTRSVYLPVQEMANADRMEAIVQLHGEGLIDSVILDIKTDQGRLNYETGIALVADKNALTEQAALTAPLIEDFKASGLRVIGKLHACIDNTLPRMNRSVSLHVASGLNWIDVAQNRYLDLTNEGAVGYLSDIIKEAAALGIDEITLADLFFPVDGRLQTIVYAKQNPDLHAEWLAALTALCGTADEAGIACSLWTKDMPEGGRNPRSGFDAKAAYERVDFLYLESESEAFDWVKSVENLAGEGDRLVLVAAPGGTIKARHMAIVKPDGAYGVRDIPPKENINE